MRRDSGTTDSIWPTTRGLPTDGPVPGNLQCDACVIGAGVVGLQTAYRLMKEGLSVVVIDDGPPGGGETARTTAHLVTAVDDRYFELESVHGKRNAALVAQSHAWAVQATEDLVRAEGIRCGWRRLPGYLFTPPRGKSVLEKEHDAAMRAGVPDLSWADRAPMPGIDSGPCLRFGGQGQLDSLRFIRGLVGVLRRGGVRIHSPAHAVKATGGDPLTVHIAGGGSVTARFVIEATNSPVFGHHAIALKQFAYRTYVIAAKVDARRLESSLLWDTADPYHYVRLAKAAGAAGATGGGDLLVVGGGDHHTGVRQSGEATYRALHRWAARRFPGLGPIQKAWSGQVWEPVDSLAFIGRVRARGRLLIATGDSGNGWTHGAIASSILTAIVSGRKSPWEALYDPRRKSAKVAPDWIAEATHMVSKVPRVLRPGDVKTAAEIPPGGGAILRHGLKLVACHRDLEGNLHERSAICRHLGCVVAWNGNEMTWDCPCHGSRYDRFGTVVNGPSNKDLKDVSPPGGKRPQRPSRQQPGRPRDAQGERVPGVRAPRRGKGIVRTPPR